MAYRVVPLVGLALAGLAAMGCAASETKPRPEQTAGRDAGAGGSCATAQGLVGSVHLAQLPIDRAKLTLTPASPSNGVKVSSATVLRGACAKLVDAYMMGTVLFENGLSVTTQGYAARISNGENGERLLRAHRVIKPGQAHPTYPGHKFVMATNLGFPDAKRRTFVGIWRGREGDVVASFSRQGDSFSVPRPLLRSPLPVRSVTYFPAPDTPAGTLGLVQEDRSGVTLYHLQWYHADLPPQ